MKIEIDYYVFYLFKKQRDVLFLPNILYYAQCFSSLQFVTVFKTNKIWLFSSIGSYEGLDGGSWYSLITKNLAIYSLSLKFWLIH